MGLRCLVGHDYGAPTTDRERSEQGEEVIVTVTEYKECRRCGHRQVISENTEVKSAAPSGSEPEPEPEPTPDAGVGTEPSAHDEFEDMSAEEDDGVILEDDPAAEPGRARGEWPTTAAEEEADGDAAGEGEEAGEADDAAEWPEPAGEDEGFDAGAAEGGGADVDFGGGLTPEAGSAGDATGEVLEATESTITKADSGPTPTGPQHRFEDGVETEYVCPSCDHAVPAVESSLRPGDICPNCQSGYLSERPRE